MTSNIEANLEWKLDDFQVQFICLSFQLVFFQPFNFRCLNSAPFPHTGKFRPCIIHTMVILLGKIDSDHVTCVNWNRLSPHCGRDTRSCHRNWKASGVKMDFSWPQGAVKVSTPPGIWKNGRNKMGIISGGVSVNFDIQTTFRIFPEIEHTKTMLFGYPLVN